MPDIEIIWGPLRSLLRERCTSYRAVQILSLTGLDASRLSELPMGTSTNDKNRLVAEVDGMYAKLEQPERARFLRIAAEELLVQKPDLLPVLDEYLRRLGWTAHEGRLVPIDILDPADLPELPAGARTDLLKAAERFRDGDLSGAVSAACGAVDSVTAVIYALENLGDPGKASFQERVLKSLSARGTLAEVRSELVALGWTDADASRLEQNLKGSMNQAAFVMQTLRARMGDVHGTKPILRPLVFDTVKWATVILRLLDSEGMTYAV